MRTCVINGESTCIYVNYVHQWTKPVFVLIMKMAANIFSLSRYNG